MGTDGLPFWVNDGDTLDLRNGHSTVKPLRLMRWLTRLVCPPGGTICDPFLGSGTTGMAAVGQGFDFVGMELREQALRVADARIRYAARAGAEVASDAPALPPKAQPGLFG